jgi:putative flippase GtrA
MHAARVSEASRGKVAARIGGLWSLPLSRFISVGLLTTALYATLALSASHLGLTATAASLTAFFITALFSYAGHKYVTFMSGGQHSFELPRFLATSAVGLVVVSFLPAFLSGMLGLPAAVPILAACVVVPAVNYVVFSRWVFRGTKTAALDEQSR